MAYTERFSEVHYPLAHHLPLTRDSAINYSDWVNVGGYHRLVLVVHVGAMTANSTLDAGFQQASAAAGTGAKSISGKTITQLTQAGGDGNEDPIIIELRTEELDVDGGFEYVRFYVTVDSNPVTYSAIMYGIVPRFAPVPTTNWAEVVD
jgi:hypothetical protein